MSFHLKVAAITAAELASLLCLAAPHHTLPIFHNANTGGSKYAILPVVPNQGDPKEPT